MDAKFTPGPWSTQRTDWRGDPVEHKIYIVGDEQESFDDEGTPTGTIATSIAIVEGNADSRETTAANARLIAAAPDLYAACKASIECRDDALDLMQAAIAKAEKGGGS